MYNYKATIKIYFCYYVKEQKLKTLFFNFRQSNERLSTLEKEKEDKFTNPTPGFTLKSLFQTPTSTPRFREAPQTPETPAMPKTPKMPKTPSTPASSRMSDVESIGSNTSATPDMAGMSLGRGRGRPRKIQQPPNMEDFPVDGTDEEKTKYIKKKTSEMYRYKKLTGPDGGQAYRICENARVKDYHKRKKEEDSQDETCSTDDSQSKKKQQSRLRYVTYVNYINRSTSR